jgi:parallel beta-helix repeat protein
MTQRAARGTKHLFSIPCLFFLVQWAVLSAYGQTQITECGTVINEGGEYVLANDLNCSGNGIVIRFNTQPIELKLNNHRITGSSSPNKSGILIDTVAGVRITGPGVISNYTAGDGVFLATGGVTISAVTCIGNKVGFNFSPGLYGKAVQAVARKNVAENNVDGFYVASGGELEGNLANGNSRDGISIANTQRVRISGNTTTFNGRYGIATQQASNDKDIRSNTALDNVGYDLFEGNSGCQNKWNDNTFGTANLSCIH